MVYQEGNSKVYQDNSSLMKSTRTKERSGLGLRTSMLEQESLNHYMWSKNMQLFGFYMGNCIEKKALHA